MHQALSTNSSNQAESISKRQDFSVLKSEYSISITRQADEK